MPSHLLRPRSLVCLGLLPILIIAVYTAIFQSGSNSSTTDPPNTHDDDHPDMAGLRGFALNPRVFNASLYKSIHDLWFAGLPTTTTAAPTQEMAMRWFGGGPEFDAQCRAAGAEALESIGPNRLALPPFTTVQDDRAHYPAMARPFASQYGGGSSSSTKEGDDIAAAAGQNAVSIVLLLDQLSRNIYRQDQGRIYGHYDRLARAVAHDVRARGLLAAGSKDFGGDVERYWLYMPLMHSEDLADHDEFDAYVRARLARAEAAGDEAAAAWMRNSLDYGERHRAIIRRFGRYPYRNKWLGRASTPEETAYMEGGGETFGSG